jgi:hypothetical protein
MLRQRILHALGMCMLGTPTFVTEPPDMPHSLFVGTRVAVVRTVVPRDLAVRLDSASYLHDWVSRSSQWGAKGM